MRMFFPLVPPPMPQPHASSAICSKCPVCQSELRGAQGAGLSNAEVNRHVDECLAAFNED